MSPDVPPLRTQPPWCTVCWGSHGCFLAPGHDGHHQCNCCPCEDHARDHHDQGCVATYPYYDGFDGRTTEFFDGHTFTPLNADGTPKDQA